MNVYAPIATGKVVKPVDVAHQAFWSLRHPLNQAYCRQRGTTFSLRQLIAFAEEVPSEILASYAIEGGEAIAEEIES